MTTPDQDNKALAAFLDFMKPGRYGSGWTLVNSSPDFVLFERTRPNAKLSITVQPDGKLYPTGDPDGINKFHQFLSRSNLKDISAAGSETSGTRRFLSTRAGNWTVVAIILVVLAIIGSVNGNSDDLVNQTTTQNTSSQSTPAKLKTGQNGVLSLGGLETAYLAKDEESYSALGRALTIKDDYAVVDLLQAGKIFSATKGSKVLVVDSTSTSLQVRILEGAESIGEAGWLPYEWVSAS